MCSGSTRAPWPASSALALASVLALGAIARPLLFASLQPELAEAKGVPLRLLATLFLAIVAVAVAEAAQIVGVLLVFTLMVGPAASARNFRPGSGSPSRCSAGLALAEAWGGVALAWWTDWPVSFWITALSAAAYGLSFLATPVRARLERRSQPPAPACRAGRADALVERRPGLTSPEGASEHKGQPRVTMRGSPARR